MISSPDLANLLLIGIGAILGALSRYYLTNWIMHRWGASFPYGTLMINLSGSTLIGCWSALIAEWNPTDLYNAFLAVGFLGSYTTFSTYALDTSHLIRSSRYQSAFCYWAISLLFGLVCLRAGASLTHYCLNRLP
jgi:fluoride exporter